MCWITSAGKTQLLVNASKRTELFFSVLSLLTEKDPNLSKTTSSIRSLVSSPMLPLPSPFRALLLVIKTSMLSSSVRIVKENSLVLSTRYIPVLSSLSRLSRRRALLRSQDMLSSSPISMDARKLLPSTRLTSCKHRLSEYGWRNKFLNKF